ncbi:CGGC domain-containing protein [Clostridium sp.]|uniref:CGGC domain-containing protein n=1 Tax=Clostridium sp. TaxID=1506 RepID=UPI0032163C46
MKIAILVREETMERCSCKGCLSAFYNKKDSFEGYGEDAELIAFTHVGGDLDHKISRMIENGVEVVHLSSCLRGKSEEYEEIGKRLSQYFHVVGYTHGSEVGKTKTAIKIKKGELL